MATNNGSTEKGWGTYHISADPRNYEVARNGHFTLLVHDLDNLLPSDYAYDRNGDNVSDDYMTGADEVIKLSVTKFTPPHYQVGVLEVRRGNSVTKYADTPTWTEEQITVKDYVGLDTKSKLMAWQSLAYDVVHDTQGRAVDYKKDCTLIEYGPDGTQIRYWDIIGCWISNITESPFELEGNGGRDIECTLVYDRAIMHLPD